MKYIISSLLIFSILLINGCGSKENNNEKYLAAADCSKVPANNTYKTSIKPILDNTCAFDGCHSTKTASDGVILDTYAGAKKSFVNGDAICSVNHDKSCYPMPKGDPKLSAEVLNILACWVKNGAPE